MPNPPGYPTNETAAVEERSRLARERLELAVSSHGKARADDNRLKTAATKSAREAAVAELRLAARKAAENLAREFGL
jgi:hypothetical protein